MTARIRRLFSGFPDVGSSADGVASSEERNSGVYLQAAELLVGVTGVAVVGKHRANSSFEEFNFLSSLLSTRQHSGSYDATSKLDQAHLGLPLTSCNEIRLPQYTLNSKNAGLNPDRRRTPVLNLRLNYF